MGRPQKKRGSEPGVLAFVHIEKAAGTTLIHILRRNYFLRYCDVRPLSPESASVFGVDDMKKYLRVNPFLRCIAGHSVVPYGTLARDYSSARFITVLRNPVNRYVSQFQYLTRERAHKFSFREFLDDDHYANFQTRKIVESGDVEQAKRVLAENFLLVGIVEQFDEFLLILKKKLTDTRFDPAYSSQNTARDKQYSSDLLDRYHDEIIERNRSDLAIYDFVRQEMLPLYRNWYGESLESDVERFRARRTQTALIRLKSGIDYAVRKMYIDPVTGLLRRASGLPADGSY